jgi:hypothetical protein
VKHEEFLFGLLLGVIVWAAIVYRYADIRPV